jgi:hypothetical protein
VVGLVVRVWDMRANSLQDKTNQETNEGKGFSGKGFQAECLRGNGQTRVAGIDPPQRDPVRIQVRDLVDPFAFDVTVAVTATGGDGLQPADRTGKPPGQKLTDSGGILHPVGVTVLEVERDHLHDRARV